MGLSSDGLGTDMCNLGDAHDMMKVLYWGTLDVADGGPAMSSYLTLKGLRMENVNAEIAVYRHPDGHTLVGNDIPIHDCHRPWPGRMAYSPWLKKELRSVSGVDIYHAHGVWQYPTYALCDVARRKGKPYLISPRGMLYPQDIAKSHARLKRWSLRWRLLDDLNRAACVHATCEEERDHCRAQGVTAPIAVIPNPVEIKTYPQPVHDGRFRLGYLGRLSPRKHVEKLILAFAHLGLKEAELVIIGGGDRDYEGQLRQLAAWLGLTNVRFTGFLSGKAKDEALASLSVLALPSEFENMGNVVLEALVRGIPCIATQGAPWRVLAEEACGWWVPFDQQAIDQAVGEAARRTAGELGAMGERGRRVAAERYSVESVARRMKQLYAWVMRPEGVATPDFVDKKE